MSALEKYKDFSPELRQDVRDVNKRFEPLWPAAAAVPFGSATLATIEGINPILGIIAFVVGAIASFPTVAMLRNRAINKVLIAHSRREPELTWSEPEPVKARESLYSKQNVINWVTESDVRGAVMLRGRVTLKNGELLNHANLFRDNLNLFLDAFDDVDKAARNRLDEIEQEEARAREFDFLSDYESRHRRSDKKVMENKLRGDLDSIGQKLDELKPFIVEAIRSDAISCDRARSFETELSRHYDGDKVLLDLECLTNEQVVLLGEYIHTVTDFESVLTDKQVSQPKLAEAYEFIDGLITELVRLLSVEKLNAILDADGKVDDMLMKAVTKV